MHSEEDPDAGWVSTLSGRSEAASRHALEQARRERRLFAHLTKEHAREGRDSYVEIDAPLELYALVRLLAPTHVVEIGVSSGVSSAYLLTALEANRRGTLHSVDLPSKPRGSRSAGAHPRASWSLPPGRDSGWAVPFPLRKRWDLRLGDKAAVLPLLSRELPLIDLFVYDVPHEDAESRREFRLVDARLPPGGVAIVDHGPSGGLCDALRAWARDRGAPTVRRAGLGLYGMRAPPARS